MLRYHFELHRSEANEVDLLPVHTQSQVAGGQQHLQLSIYGLSQYSNPVELHRGEVTLIRHPRLNGR